MRGAFQAAGQNCIGIERFIISSAVYPTFVTEMTRRVKSLRLNDVLSDGSGQNKTDLERSDVGAMVTDRLFDRLEGLIADAVKEGARLVIGGKRHVHPQFPKGHYFQPTLLVDVKESMKIAREEVFAPVMLCMEFEMVGEAISLANGTRYGLGASVFGKDLEECRYVAKRLRAGMVCTNGESMSPPLPYHSILMLVPPARLWR
jgi:acyl-CoA reductase-like NAD-dependent aldehyde dehydrogenase